MADGSKRVFFVNGPAHPIFTEIVEKRADISLDKLRNDSPDDIATPILAGAHAYQTGSARDELAKKYHAGPDLLRRTQSLLIVSTNGAGYDTVNLKACTEAGVLCLNQAGGNKEAVAEHALAMMLSCRSASSRPTARSAARLSTATFSWATTCSARPSASSGSAMSASASRNCAAACSACGSFLRPLCRRRDDDTARRREGRPRHADARVRLRLDQLSAHRREPRPDRRDAVRADEAERLFRHHRARQHPRRGGAGRRAAGEKDRGRGPRRMGEGAAAARSSAAEIRQRDGEPAHRRRHARGARQHGPHRGRADARRARRQAGRARAQPGGLAALCGALQGDVRHGAARARSVGRQAVSAGTTPASNREPRGWSRACRL